jgi:hypothetical protein
MDGRRQSDRAMAALGTRASPYFLLAVVLALVAVVLLHGTASAVLVSLAVLTLVGACVRAAALAVRDDDVSSRTIRSPAGRTLGIMGAESRGAQRRRRRRREGAGGAPRKMPPRRER